MPRTTAALVKGILMDDYGPLASDGTLPDLTPRIASANALLNEAIRVSADFKGIGPSFTTDTSLLELIERWLAAHFYAVTDQPFTSTSKGGASASFQAAPSGEGLHCSKYGVHAMKLDVSGTLSAIDGQKWAGVKWMGKTKSEQVNWWERD